MSWGRAARIVYGRTGAYLVMYRPHWFASWNPVAEMASDRSGHSVLSFGWERAQLLKELAERNGAHLRNRQGQIFYLLAVDEPID